VLVPWRLLDCCFGFGYYCWCLAASSCHQTRYAIAARSAAAAPLCHRPSLFLFLLCLSEQGEPAAETQQTLHARWIPPRLTGAQGIALKRSLQHCWKKGRRDGPALLACCQLTPPHEHTPRQDSTSTLQTSLALFTTIDYRYPLTGSSHCYA
jgi:hypothetical protein